MVRWGWRSLAWPAGCGNAIPGLIRSREAAVPRPAATAARDRDNQGTPPRRSGRQGESRSSSISHRINAERIVLLGWGRAILLQLSHPLVAAGVYEHSGFRSTTWAAVTRLYHTVHAMLALTFGSEAERDKALDGIRQIHQRVHGALKTATRRFPEGTAYSAEDPDLVLWVHATLLESVPMAYERFVGPLTIAERDAYCDEAAPLAIALKARSEEVPRTWAEARAYLDRMYSSGTLEVTEQAQTLSRAVSRRRQRRRGSPVRRPGRTASSRWACCRRRSDGNIASTGRASISGRSTRWCRRSVQCGA